MSKVSVDEDLSRMEGTYGADVIGKLKQLDVFISGLRGLGIETAKNLILTGPHSVVVHDDGKAELADLGTNFYLTEADIGKPRGGAVVEKLGQLNPNVSVRLHEGDITTDFLGKFNVVVFTNNELPENLAKWNAFARSKGIVFLVGSLLGVTASLFADYGDSFQVRDINGEPLKTLIVDDISVGKNGIVTVDAERHLLGDGDHVKIEEVKGMSEHSDKEQLFQLEDKVTDINQSFVIKTSKNPKAFLIGDTTGLKEYKGGGIISQLKVPQIFKHASFEQQLLHPTFEEGYVDFTKFGRNEQLHFARLAIYRFQKSKGGALPALHDEKEAKEVVALAKTILEEHKKKVEEKASALVLSELPEDLILKVALYARTELTALAALFGGVLAQEITKQTGKYKPLTQWFHFDALELLNEKGIPEDAKVEGKSRYDHQIAIFGKAWQDKVLKQNVFLVGCGALGCEYVKALALTGLGLTGAVHVTDDDNIELSNLSRQFLFRRKHVGKSKALSATEAAKEMNPQFEKTLHAYKTRVEPKSENVFDDEFWGKIDIVINALDNNIARQYTDSKCVFYRKPLFESGTLGTKANSVICLPGLTPSYSEGAQAGEEGGIAKCTLRNFPSLPLHCIEWAREKFDDLFVVDSDNVNSFLEDKDAFFKKIQQSPLEARDALTAVKRWLELSQKPSLEICVELVFNEFVKQFRDQIKDLTANFPEDARNTRTDEDGKVIDLGPFWHGGKRFPNVASFSVDNDLHLDFVWHGAAILAHIFNVSGTVTRDQVKAIASKLKAPEWKASGKKIELEEDTKEKKGEEKEKPAPTISDEDQEEVKKLEAHLKAVDLKDYKKLNSSEFEKDDDKNHHVDFIYAATNLRAYNYQIKASTRSECRMVAGKIIPAIATTTAMITGFVQIEILKYLQGAKLENHRAATVNLGVNNFTIELLPDPIKKKSGMDQATYMQVTALPEGWTVWDSVKIEAPGVTLEEFLVLFSKQHFDSKIDSITSPDGKVLYIFSDKDSYEKNKSRKLVDVYAEVVGPIFPENRKYVVLEVAGEDSEGNTALIPKVVYYFKK